MHDDHPIRMPQTAQVIEAAPRRQPKPADPCAMVIFGAGGDLTKRLVMPALYNLSHTKVLPEKFALIGVDLAQGTAESWRDHLYDMLKSFVGNAAAEFDVDQIDEAAWKRLAEKMSYVQGDLTKSELYEKIACRVERGGEDPWHAGQRHLLPRRRRPVLWYRGGATRQREADRSGRGQGRQASVLAPRGDREAVRPQP